MYFPDGKIHNLSPYLPNLSPYYPYSREGALAGDVYYLRADDGAHVPVSGARVAVAGSELYAVSDSAGQFAFPALAPGAYTLTITHPKFHAALQAQATVEEGKTARVEAHLGQSYYLLIGIGDYSRQGAERLVSPTRDAREMGRALASAYAGDSVLLLDGQATRRHIIDALAHIAAVITPGDYFVFYYSGHGGSDRADDAPGMKIDYLEPADSTPKSYDRDISDTDMVEWLARFPNPRHITVILDNCYAGSFFHGGVARGDRWKYTAAAKKGQPLSVPFTVLAASASQEISVDTDYGSLFTKQLLAALTTRRAEADADHNHHLSARELFDYAAPRTASAARLFGERQHPQLLLGGNPDFGTILNEG